MKKVKVIIGWAPDGTISAMMQDEMFAGMGETVEAAVDDLRKGVGLLHRNSQRYGIPL